MELAELPKPRDADQERKERGRLNVAPPGEEDVFDQDGAFGIERILDHAVDEDGIVQFKVRYVGFGPDDDRGTTKMSWRRSRQTWWLITRKRWRPSWELLGGSQSAGWSHCKRAVSDLSALFPDAQGAAAQKGMLLNPSFFLFLFF